MGRIFAPIKVIRFQSNECGLDVVNANSLGVSFSAFTLELYLHTASVRSFTPHHIHYPRIYKYGEGNAGKEKVGAAGK